MCACRKIQHSFLTQLKESGREYFCLPCVEIWVSKEISVHLQHGTLLQNERWQYYLGKVHANTYLWQQVSDDALIGFHASLYIGQCRQTDTYTQHIIRRATPTQNTHFYSHKIPTKQHQSPKSSSPSPWYNITARTRQKRRGEITHRNGKPN